MIAYLSGAIASIRNQTIVVKSGDFGFEVRTSPQFLLSARVGDLVDLHTRMNVREDEISLFGFETEEELRVFDLLCTVSGIGPKIALAALGSLGASEVARAISSGDEATLLSTPGVGSKTAKLILVTLSGKVSTANSGAITPDHAVATALVGLGVAAPEADKLLIEAKRNLGGEAGNSELLKEALRLRRN